jgi:helicase
LYVNDFPSRFNVIVLLPKKTILDLRILLFEFPKRGQKLEKLKAFRHLRVAMEYQNSNRLRPVKVEYKEHGTQFIQTKEFINLLRQANNVFLIADNKNSLEDFAYMLKDYQINYEKVDVCRLCMLDNRITFLKKDVFFRNQEPMCYTCAMKEITDEGEFRGFKPNSKLSQSKSKFSQRIGELVKKFRDVSKIIKMFEPGFDGSKNPELTYYDTIKSKPEASRGYDINQFSLPQEFLDILKEENITELLPIQHIAIQNGLLDNANLLVVAPTGTGKTLIGELAGIPKLFKSMEGKMLYLGNLVALVNQKYENFKRRYGRYFNVAIRVGMSKIDVGNEEIIIVDEDIQNADIITASYEAFDFLLRKGKEEIERMGKISTIIIDEIQILDDEERGPILAGLIARLLVLFPEVQLIGLSATINNSDMIGKVIHLKSIFYDSRPVPLERHLILCKSEYEKQYNMIQLVKLEGKIVSQYGFKGSTIIFTNARWKTEFFADMLQNEKGINAMAYHGGLTYRDRKFIEAALERGLVQAVCTTYALGAGFDAPCSQVIFESMAMGIDLLAPNMYWNMMGRAGRFHMHPKGKIVMLAEIGRAYPGTVKTEDQIALELLDSQLEDLRLDFDPDTISSQVLAAIAAGINRNIEQFYEYLIGAKEELPYLLKGLKKNKLIESKAEFYEITTLGRAIALSFFTVDEGLMVVRLLKANEDLLNIAIQMEFFDNIYITENVKTIFLNEFKFNLPNKFITARIMGISAKVGRFKRKLRQYPWLSNAIALWQKVFFNCHCGNAPYCDCPLFVSNRKLVELRMDGLTPKRISRYLEKNFALKVYSGDLLRFFDNLIHRLQGIERLSVVIGRQDLADEIEKLIQKIEKPI